MKTEAQILEKISELKQKVFEIKTSRRAEIQEYVIWVNVLEWVLQEETDFIKQRLEKIKFSNGTVIIGDDLNAGINGLDRKEIET